MLGNYLSKEMEFCKEFVTFKTFSKLLIELAGIEINEINNTHDFWNSLPDKAFDGIENSYMKNYFDHLIIDEAQDIMEPNNIIILSSLLTKGFNKNKLTIFGDFEWQSLYDFNKNNIEDPLVIEHNKLVHEKL